MGVAVGTDEGVEVTVAMAIDTGACVAVGSGTGEEEVGSSEHPTISRAMSTTLMLSQNLTVIAIPTSSDIISRTHFLCSSEVLRQLEAVSLW